MQVMHIMHPIIAHLGLEP